MNYLKESMAFYDFAELNQMSTGQIALWHALLDVNNKSKWQEWFTVANIALQLHSGLSESGIKAARNKLKQLGLIDFKPRGTKATAYHLKSLTNQESDEDSVTPSNRDSSGISVGVSSVVGTGVSNGSSSALVKRNETKRNETITSDKSKTTSHKSKRTYAENSTEYKLAMYLFDKIKQNNPDHKDLTSSQKQTWADHIRLMIERDKRTPKQIHNMIDWCQSDDFWKLNILSTAKLRKQYDKMAPKARRDWEQRGFTYSGASSGKNGSLYDDPWFN